MFIKIGMVTHFINKLKPNCSWQFVMIHTTKVTTFLHKKVLFEACAFATCSSNGIIL